MNDKSKAKNEERAPLVFAMAAVAAHAIMTRGYVVSSPNAQTFTTETITKAAVDQAEALIEEVERRYGALR